MKKSDPKTGGAKHLSDDDKALWEQTAQSTERLRRGKPRVLGAQAALDSAAPPNASTRGAPLADTGRQLLSEVRKPPSPPAATAKPPPLAIFDRNTARKIRSGQVEIEARLDLHGMRQSEAHAALRKFLLRCHARGRRLVLVITGKGAPARLGEKAESTRERGVLRGNVPRWLAEPEFRAIVVSYTAAAAHHGGDGALYVHLRSPR